MCLQTSVLDNVTNRFVNICSIESPVSFRLINTGSVPFHSLHWNCSTLAPALESDSTLSLSRSPLASVSPSWSDYARNDPRTHPDRLWTFHSHFARKMSPWPWGTSFLLYFLISSFFFSCFFHIKRQVSFIIQVNPNIYDHVYQQGCVFIN